MENQTTDSQERQPTLEEQISKVLASADEAGKIQFEEGVDPLFKAATLAEKKFRDTQAGFTKSQQELAKLKAKAEVLETQLTSTVELSAEQVTELEELKFDDPDAWFAKRQEYEKLSRTQTNAKLQELTDTAATKALQDLTLRERQEALTSFQSRTGIVLTDDVMQNDIPPRLQNKINTLPFEDYLTEVATYLNKGKVVKPTDASLDQTDINALPGASGNPSKKQASVIL